MRKVSISVCMATYNGRLYIEEQINSILDQLPADGELIISDDGSSDGSIEIINSYASKDERVIFIEGPQNGLVRNFSHSLSHSKGEIIILSDQDDIWYPGRIGIIQEMHEKYDTILVNANIIDADGSVIKEAVYSDGFVIPNICSLLFKNIFVGCLMSFTRPVLNDAIDYIESQPMHDWWIGIVSCIKYKVGFVSQPYVGYRRHGQNVSQTFGVSNNTLFKKLAFRLALLKGILRWKTS